MTDQVEEPRGRTWGPTERAIPRIPSVSRWAKRCDEPPPPIPNESREDREKRAAVFEAAQVMQLSRCDRLNRAQRIVLGERAERISDARQAEEARAQLLAAVAEARAKREALPAAVSSARGAPLPEVSVTFELAEEPRARGLAPAISPACKAAHADVLIAAQLLLAGDGAAALEAMRRAATYLKPARVPVPAPSTAHARPPARSA